MMRLYLGVKIIYRHPFTRDFVEDLSSDRVYACNNIAVIFDRMSAGLTEDLCEHLRQIRIEGNNRTGEAVSSES